MNEGQGLFASNMNYASRGRIAGSFLIEAEEKDKKGRIVSTGRLLGSFRDEFVERKAVAHRKPRQMQCTAYAYVE